MKNIAFVFDLDQPVRNHHDTYAGAQRFAREKANWKCLIDDFPHASIPHHLGGMQKYDGIVGRIGPELAAYAKRNHIPVVNIWYASPAKDLVTVHPDFTHVGGVVAEHLLERGFRRFGMVAQNGAPSVNAKK